MKDIFQALYSNNKIYHYNNIEDNLIERNINIVRDDIISSINKDAFVGCASLTSANFPNCITIGSSAFRYCSSLILASFPNCTTIGNQAFARCFSLVSISFPNCIIIDNQAFQWCDSLTSVSFPNCTTIGNNAFQRCSSLTSLYLLSASVCRLSNSNVFFNTPMSSSSYTGSFGSIYVPSSLVSAYKIATNWTYYSDRITSYIP